MKTKFVKCNHCQNLALMVDDKGVPMMCCGEIMQELVPNTTDAATEKHVPVVTVTGNEVVVLVGEIQHPMTEAHLITWIYLETTQGCYMKPLTHETPVPCATFIMCENEKPVAAYEYCNLHGLWKKEI